MSSGDARRMNPARRGRSMFGLRAKTVRNLAKTVAPKTDADHERLARAEARRQRRQERNLRNEDCGTLDG